MNYIKINIITVNPKSAVEAVVSEVKKQKFSKVFSRRNLSTNSKYFMIQNKIGDVIDMRVSDHGLKSDKTIGKEWHVTNPDILSYRFTKISLANQDKIYRYIANMDIANLFFIQQPHYIMLTIWVLLIYIKKTNH